MATEAPPVPSPTTAAAPPNAGIFDGYLTGAFTAGAFLGSVIVQIVTTGLMAPALAATTPVGPTVALAAGGVYVYEAITAAGGVGGGLFGTWLYSRHAPAP
jgi:hypothetical protein